MQIIQFVLIGAAAGMLSGLLGVGGGIIIIPALVYFGQMDIKLAAGTSLAVIIPTALTGAISHSQNHNVNWRVSALVAIGAVAAAYFSPRLAEALPAETLRRLFAALLIFTAVRMLLPSR